MTPNHSLINRLEAADGPDRAEIVRLIHVAMNDSYLTTANQREKIAQNTADRIIAPLRATSTEAGE